jgi:hypothetical protein
LLVNESELLISFDGLANATAKQYTPLGFAIQAPDDWTRCSAEADWELWELPEKFEGCDLITLKPREYDGPEDQQQGTTVYLRNKAHSAVLAGESLQVQLLTKHSDGRQGFYQLEVSGEFSAPYFDLTIGGLSEGENGKVVEYHQHQLLKDALDLQFQYNGAAAAVLIVEGVAYPFDEVITANTWSDELERKQAYYFSDQGKASGLTLMSPTESLAALTDEFKPGVMLLSGTTGQGLHANNELLYQLTRNMPGFYLGDSQLSYYTDTELDGKQAFIRTFVNGEYVDSETFTFSMTPFEQSVCEGSWSVNLRAQPQEQWGASSWLFDVSSAYEVNYVNIGLEVGGGDYTVWSYSEPLRQRSTTPLNLVSANWHRETDWPNPDKENTFEIAVRTENCGEQTRVLRITPSVVNNLPYWPEPLWREEPQH